MVAPLVSVQVSEVRTTIVGLNATVTNMAIAAYNGLYASAMRVRARAKANVAPYRYDGRLSDAITIWPRVRSSTYVSIGVGIKGNTFAPEGKTFEVGWRSKKGLQPPTAPIAAWVLRRGITSDPKQAKHVGYVIARAQGQSGYSFGERHWLSDAWQGEQIATVATVEEYVRGAVGWMGQPRVPSGLPNAGTWMRGPG